MPMCMLGWAKRGAQASRLRKALLKWSKEAEIQGRMVCHGKVGERRQIPIGERLFVSLDCSFFFGLVHEFGKIRWMRRNGVQWAQIINFSRRHSKQYAGVIVGHYDKKLAVSERAHLQDLKFAFFFGAVAVQWDTEFNEINRRAGERG